jgi:metallophosphoesterase (TIGR03767 family)
MGISRRNFLAVTGVGVVAAAIEVGGLAVAPTAALATGAPATPLGLPGRGLFGGLTTVDQTVMNHSAGTALGYFRLELAPGEPHLVRADLRGYAQPMLALGAFVQITDMQITDDQSPGRVEFTDRWADLNNPWNPTVDSAYRPQEFLSTHIVEAMARAIRKVGNGPRTGLPFAFTIATGDLVDNVQYNETRWCIDLLDGGRTIRADSGQIGLEQSVSYRFARDANTPSAVFHESLYWSPDAVTDNFGRIDHYRAQHDFPIVPGLLAAARRPYTSTGLGMPWYAAMGNHDAEIQGNYPVHPTFVVGLKLPDISGQATGTDKAYTSTTAFGSDGNPDDVADFVRNLRYAPVVADSNRRFLTHEEFAKEHWTTTGLPRGHGFSSAGGTYYKLPSSDNDLIQYITIDTVNYDGGANGRVPSDQYSWLEDQLKANSSRYIAVDFTPVHQSGVKDKLFVIFAHHTLASTDNSATDVIDVGDADFAYGGALEQLLLRYPNVVLMVVGHTHRNMIIPHARGHVTELGAFVPGTGGFWEVSTASHIDWPSQSRLVEIAAGKGVLSIFTTMLDIDSPPEYGGDLSDPASLASLARELAFNDPTEHIKLNVPDTDRHGDANDRNTQLLVPAPFPIAVPQQWGNPVALGRNADGRLEAFGTNAFDEIWQRYQPGGGADPWTPAWSPVEGRLRAVAIESNLDGRLEVCGVNGDGVVFHRYQQTTGGWSQWEVLGFVNARSIAIARNTQGRLEIFATTDINDVLHIVQTAANAPTWGSWSAGFGGLSTDPTRQSDLFVKIAAKSTSDGRIVLVAVSDSGQLWQRIQALGGGAWSAWGVITTDDHFHSVAVGRGVDGRMLLFGVNQNWRVIIASQVGQGLTWAGWTVAPGDTSRMTQVSAEYDWDGRVQMIGVDNAGKIWSRRQTTRNSGFYTAWTDFGGFLRADVPAIPATPLQAPRLVNLIQADTGRYLDAHEIAEKDFAVVTRPFQTTDNTQRWLLTDLGSGVYTIMQSSSGRFLDAYETAGQDFRVNTRPAQTDGTQNWLLNDVGGGLYTVRQVSTGQFLDAYELSSQDFQAVTRAWKNANEQRWRIVNV